jgi:hypothetical protein
LHGWTKNHSTKTKYNRLAQAFHNKRTWLCFSFLQTIESNTYAKLVLHYIKVRWFALNSS